MIGLDLLEEYEALSKVSISLFIKSSEITHKV
jgi:hypothetical protein